MADDSTDAYPPNCPKSGHEIRLNGNLYKVCFRRECGGVCRFADGKWTPLDAKACSAIVALDLAKYRR